VADRNRKRSFSIPILASRSSALLASSRWPTTSPNFLRTLALPDEVGQWTLTTLREKLIKIGARIMRHSRYVVFQLAEVAVPRALFAAILRRIDRLRGSPVPAP
jgi:hypothetical protein